MFKKLLCIISVQYTLILYSQENALKLMLSDSSMAYASVSVCFIDTDESSTVFEFNSEKSLMPASTLKLVSTSAALELLGPEYRFRTILGYTGTIYKETGTLDGNLVVKGGGDPALGSTYFKKEYGDFIKRWIDEIRKIGIVRITGKVLVDDSYYDYIPVPSMWTWEDLGNYYGAGVFGLSVFDNTFEIHFETSETGNVPAIKYIKPEEAANKLSNYLVSEGENDNGYIYAAPYSINGWMAGEIPVKRDDFVLKASVTDPPMLLAEIMNRKLDSAGIIIFLEPSTSRIDNVTLSSIEVIREEISPPLDSIIEVLNHESVNLFAEHLTKELGKVFGSNGSTRAGIEIIYKFMRNAGIDTTGLFMEDGSGLSPFDAINARCLSSLLVYMKTRSRYSDEFYSSLPEAGREGTVARYFKDPVFNSRLRAKSGSLTRVRSFAGYLKTISGKTLSFSILINNYSGPPGRIITGIENILKETILYK